MASNWDEEEVARPTINIYDGPQPYNFEPVRRERANEEMRDYVGKLPIERTTVQTYIESGACRVGDSLPAV